MKSNIEIKILDTTNATQYVSDVRTFTKESIMDIKNKISNNDVIIDCEYIEHPEELMQVYETVKKLEMKGARVEIRQNFRSISRIIDLTVMENLIERDKLIEKQIEEIKEKELE